MLARANRLVQAADYRNAVRRGRRFSAENTVLYVLHRPGALAPRFGFIVSKTVGNAVTRNLIRRRLKSVAHGLLETVPSDCDLVIRALPKASEAPWSKLVDEVSVVVSGERRS